MKCEICGFHFLLKTDMCTNGLCCECYNENPDNLLKVLELIK